MDCTLGTVVSGPLDVTIEGIGTFGGDFASMFLQGYAGHVYVVLTGKLLFDDGNFFELVSFDPKKRELIVRVKK